jgi:signal transduction histidine kinase
MTVHSEVGNVLLESRYYLRDPASFDEEKLLKALKYTNTYLLREYEEDDTARDALTDAVETAEAIGVDVVISGPIPAGAPYRPLLAAAIDECASNAVKHANGDQLTVEIQHTDTEITYILHSNGDEPKEPIRESGGLLSLRSLVEKEGGTMRIEATSCFALTIRLPKTH